MAVRYEEEFASRRRVAAVAESLLRLALGRDDARDLAGRTLRDLVMGHDTDLTRLPWTGHRVRRWEPEPLRWAGVHALYRLYRAADRREDAGLTRTSRMARAANVVAGR